MIDCSTCNLATGCCNPNNTPIIVDIEGDGYQMTSVDDGVDFDIASDGHRYRVSWTAATSDDAWLVLDRNGNGRVDSAAELFGSVTEQPPNSNPNGFEALRVLDQVANGGNANGWIDSGDQMFARLQLWRDSNHSGISESNELFTLSQLGISGISLNYHKSKRIDEYGNQFQFRARVVRTQRTTGREHWAYDVFLVLRS